MTRTRFAPSPTGNLHVGNARMAVLNWLFARHDQGEFVLRIEDTDADRNVAEAEAAMLEDLRWLGLDWDEGPTEGGDAGPHSPYHQSRRAGYYHAHADRLLREGKAFRCFCTTEILERKRADALARGQRPHYDGTCRDLSDAEARAFAAEGRAAAVRFRVPHGIEIHVHDSVRGDVHFDSTEIGDFIILRSDAVATYNFAVVVDDMLMRISHVIRGIGHLSNTPRQVLLYQAFEVDPPAFAHAPTVLGPDRQKLSKRNGAKPLAEYRREGFHPDAVVNYLSLLSWSSASEDEFLPRSRLIAEISLDRIGASDVVFDPDKLRWLSAKHIDAMPLEAVVEAVAPFLDRERYPLSDEQLPAAVGAVRSHLSAFGEINDHMDAFVPTLDADGLVARANLAQNDTARTVLAAARNRLEVLESWNAAEIADAIKLAGKDVDARGRALYEPLRTALTGATHGPPLGAVIEVLGRTASLHLIGELLSGEDPPT